MFLKSLEIRGFKSFADKTELGFKKGVTAVVGPNGSGKSNIADAVRWVLGEQSVKTLRGGKMEDVIFSGTQYRKSLGLAEVSLTLDNGDGELSTEYSDVTVTRRIFRSGESEYLINNTQCRLKDINALFMDTGIGKEGYSLIGQGKIDAILSGKPEERRGLLEEAAGIVKYKTRKQEAEKKLSNTEQNLIRINDIISTYEERLEPLRIENEKAKLFLELSNKLKDREVSILVHKIKKSEEKINSQEKIIDDIKKENDKLKEDLNSNKSLLEEKENRLESLEKNFNEEKMTYYKNKEDSGELISEIEILKERIKNIKETINNNEKLFLEYKEKFNTLKVSKDKLEDDLLERSKIQKDLNLEIEQYEKSIRDENNYIEEKKKLLVSIIEEKSKSEKSFVEINKDLLIINNEIENAEINLSSLKDNYKNHENSMTINISTKDMVSKKIESDRENIYDLKEKIKNKNKEIYKTNEDIAFLEKEHKILSNNYNKLEANKNILTRLEKQYEGYTKSVKYLMEHLEKGFIKVSSCSVLGDIIKVPKDYETAIEIALGGAISNVITENEEDAKKLISYLKEKKLGRATFLPLTIIKGKRLSLEDKLKKVSGYIGLASDLIEYDIRFKNIIENILGRTVVCADMDTALKVAKIINFSYKIVTITGEIVNPGGALTGGSIYQKNTSIISRKREIEDITINIEKAKLELEVKEKEILKNKNILRTYQEEIITYNDNIHKINVNIATLENEIRNIEKDILRIRNLIKASENEIKFNDEKIEKLSLKYDEKKKTIEDIKDKNIKRDETIKILELEIENKENKIKSKKELITEKKILKAQVDEIVINKISEIKRIEKEIEELEEKIKFIENNKKQCDESIKNFTKSIENKKIRISEIKEEIISLEEKFKVTEVEKLKIKEDIKKLNSSIEGLFIENRKVEDEIHKNQVIKIKQEGERENYIGRLNEEYSLTYAEASNIAYEIENEDMVSKEVAIFKGKISKLGNVNVSAINEYKETLEKYEFMSTQRDDLTNSKEELLTVIDEMTSKMRELFRENFKILNSYFGETFKELFKGGSAELILAEGDELTANIDINVQPPGKKLQNINLMSGGEKVLSAIALLFSILKMKPTPFCILDEIEAALDDANVHRYAGFLNKFSERIQFIVITHRKGTMEASDVMYGVTMEEKGVSKVVSVNFAK